MMKERPILFSGSMVKALLDGSKTQTRRVVKPQPREYEGGTSFICHGDRTWSAISLEGDTQPFKCQYGRVSEKLWVRETFGHATRPCPSRGWVDGLEYRADELIHEHLPLNEFASQDVSKYEGKGWRPSIFMPRWASRITLEITDVRVERLQDISEADAKAEGVGVGEDRSYSYAEHGLHYTPFKTSFSALWESINGKGSWDVNPWVWVIQFKMLPATSPA